MQKFFQILQEYAEKGSFWAICFAGIALKETEKRKK